MDKRGYLHHPLVLMLIAFIVGVVLTALVAKQVIPFPIGIC